MTDTAPGAPAPLPAVAGAPTTPTTPAVLAAYERMDLMYRLAQRISSTEMVPKALRGRPNAALAVMIYGHELGLEPMTALREVFIIEGTPSCSAKLMRALIYRAGHQLRFVEVSSRRVIVDGERNDGLGSARVIWTIEDARVAQLTAKDVWKRYPRQMLTARATSELARLIFSDTTIGYTPEELAKVDLSAHYDGNVLADASTSGAATLDYIDVADDDVLGGEDSGYEFDPDAFDRPAHDLAADVLDAEDAQDAEWLRLARGCTCADWPELTAGCPLHDAVASTPVDASAAPDAELIEEEDPDGEEP